MKTIYKYLNLLFLIVGSFNIALAQTVTNVRVQQEGEQIIITYDLDKTAYVYVYVSIGDSEQYTLLTAVAGNVGKGVQPGTNRRITWTPLEECTKFTARDVCFRVESMSDVPLFWVSPTKAVIFAPGNLQYQPSTNTWRFAPHQWECIGEANKNISKTYNGWIDLFGWSASNTTAPFGVSASQSDSDYAGNFVDWGINKIGSNAPNTWRTPTYDEWQYLFRNTRGIMAKVNDVLGFMLLPDGFAVPQDITIRILGDGSMLDGGKDFNESDYISNVYTVDEFIRLEAMGCVFLPCSGCRYGSNVHNIDSIGDYWSNTYGYNCNPQSREIATFMEVRRWAWTGTFWTDCCSGLSSGLSVRLVQEVSLEKYAEFVAQNVRFKIEAMAKGPFFRVSPTKKVIFSPGNLQYCANTNTWRFAPHQWEYIGETNDNRSQTYEGWIDLFDRGTGDNPTKEDVDTRGYLTFVDWGTNKIGNDAPNTWRTLTNEEWKYLLMHTRWTIARVDSVLGFMLLPDDFSTPAGMALKVLRNGNIAKDYHYYFEESDYASNQYSISEFTRLEARGCVFLPCAGYRFRNSSHAYGSGSFGGYFSASPHGSGSAGDLSFRSTWAGLIDNQYYGFSVRLVRDVK